MTSTSIRQQSNTPPSSSLPAKPPLNSYLTSFNDGQGLQFYNASAELLKNPPKAPEYDPFSDIDPNKVLPQHIVDPKAYDTSKMGDIDFI
jgi:hypothetical protein